MNVKAISVNVGKALLVSALFMLSNHFLIIKRTDPNLTYVNNDTVV